MPYLSVTTSVRIDEDTRRRLQGELGRLIAIIPGKSEADLLLRLEGELPMIYGGKEQPCAYVDLRILGKTTEEAKQRFTREVIGLLCRELSMRDAAVYLTIAEFSNWGYDGEYH